MTARHLILSLALVLALSACGRSGADDTPSPGESLAIETYVGSELSLDEQRCILEGTRVLDIEPERITADALTAVRALRAVRALGAADVLVIDADADPEVIKMARRDAEREARPRAPRQSFRSGRPGRGLRAR